jgi:protein-L-isoaspartate(D-aspartate) O-methyltransferase
MHFNRNQPALLIPPFLPVLPVAFCLLFSVIDIATGQGTQKKKYESARNQMVDLAVAGAGISNERVLASMRDTPREAFIPPDLREHAYLDAALPIGHEQTISSPFIVAFMTESLDPQPSDRVLEIGTGSGYQAAILSPLVNEVYTIEIVRPLGEEAARTLKKLNYDNVHVRVGDGFLGWPEKAPFNKIIVTCSPEDVPVPLQEQLAEGGLMVIPVGQRHQQNMMLYKKENGELVPTALRPTLFVPMTGTAEDDRKVLPDPAHPKILNGDFEEDLPENGFVQGWYYQRSLELVDDPKAPGGKRYVRFAAKQAGQKAHLMQGFAIDGREIAKVTLSASVKCDNVLAGLDANDLPVVALTFYDELRREVGTGFMGPFRGTRDWQNLDHVIEVPKDTREAIVRIGLFGATGEASFDNILIRPEKRKGD